MKKLTHIFITALLTLCGCMPGGDRVNFVRYSYRNNTGREISVTVKFTQPYSVDPSFSIPPGESHQFTIEGGWGMPDPAPFEYDGYGYGDNDRVIVSNGVRTVVFVRSDHDSIFDLGKYTILSPGEGGNHYEFVFDEAFFTGDGTLQTRAASSGLDDNPYSLSQVQQAYNIVADSENLPAVTLTPTDYYVRFFVADSVQYLALCDMEVELFDYPMHLDLTDEEEWEYADQDPTEGMWFYTTVSPYFEFPDGITYEILDDIYIQRMATVLTRAPIEHQMSDEVWDAVLEKAFEISGYEPTPQTRGEKWYPSATVKYKTDHPQYLNTEFPLEGVKVRVSQGVNWAVVYTDEHGNTGNIERNSGRMFKKPVNYKIKWEDSRWNIRSGRNGQAKTWGPKKSTSSWNITFSGANIDAKYATAHKALYNYVYKNDDFAKTRNITICGINKLNTAVIDDAHQDGRTVGKFNWLNPALGMNAVRLWIRDPNNISAHRPNWKVEETMYHELGHASYYTALRRDGGAGHNIHK